MARSEARLQFGIWRDGLDGLSPHAKLLYVVLLTEPTVNHAGVGAVRVALWARNANLTVAETQKALAELVDGTYVLMDDETEEVFVRTMIRNDGVWKQPYVLKGALQEALLTTSRFLRRALAGELRKLPPRQPDGVSKAGRPVIYPDPHAAADVLDPQDSPPPVRKPSPDPSETLSEGSQDGSKTLGGRGGGRGGGEVTVSSSSSSVGARTRATRIPEDFTVTDAMVEWARANVPNVDGRRETEKFIDHFLAASGQVSRKQDWVSAWRNWMRKADEFAASRPGHLRSVPAPVLPVDPTAAVNDLRTRGDAQAAANLIGAVWVERAQPPSDRTDPRQWSHARAVEFIDAHEPELRAALTERKTG